MIFIYESDMHFTLNTCLMISSLLLQFTLFILKVIVCVLLHIFIASMLHFLTQFYRQIENILPYWYPTVTNFHCKIRGTLAKILPELISLMVWFHYMYCESTTLQVQNPLSTMLKSRSRNITNIFWNQFFNRNFPKLMLLFIVFISLYILLHIH